MAGDDAVAEDVLLVEPELGRPMGDERVELDERAGIEQEVESLARGQLAPGVLSFDPDGSPAEQRLGAHPLEPAQSLFIRRHRGGTLPVSLRKDGCAIIAAHIDAVHEPATRRCDTRRIPDRRGSDIHRFGEQLAHACG